MKSVLTCSHTRTHTHPVLSDLPEGTPSPFTAFLPPRGNDLDLPVSAGTGAWKSNYETPDHSGFEVSCFNRKSEFWPTELNCSLPCHTPSQARHELVVPPTCALSWGGGFKEARASVRPTVPPMSPTPFLAGGPCVPRKREREGEQCVISVPFEGLHFPRC